MIVKLGESRLAIGLSASLGLMSLVSVGLAGLPMMLTLSILALVLMLTAAAVCAETKQWAVLRVEKERLLLTNAASDRGIVTVQGFWDLSPWLLYVRLRGEYRNYPLLIWRDSCTEEDRRQLRRFLYNR